MPAHYTNKKARIDDSKRLNLLSRAPGSAPGTPLNSACSALQPKDSEKILLVFYGDVIGILPIFHRPIHETSEYSIAARHTSKLRWSDSGAFTRKFTVKRLAALIILSLGFVFSVNSYADDQTPPNTSTDESQLVEHNHYVNKDGQVVHSPTHTKNGVVPAGATAQCSDGSYSFSQHHSGTCSHHGGVSTWLN